MQATTFSLDAYLRRIGFEGKPAADVATLRQMMQRQVRSVPFENLDVQAGKVVSIAPDDIAAKILGTARGGYCYEVNSLFAMACQAIGIPYRLLGARPIVPGPRKARSHMIVLAFVEDQAWLCDTGYGRFGLREPIRLEATEPVQQDHDIYQIVRDEDWLRIEVRLAGDEDEWNPLYGFNLSPFEVCDFVATNYYNSTCPDAVFVQKLLLVRHTPTGRHVLFGDQLKSYEDGRLTERVVAAEAMARTVRDLFGLELPAQEDGA